MTTASRLKYRVYLIGPAYKSSGLLNIQSRSSVGQSTTLIMQGSAVQVCSGLPSMGVQLSWLEHLLCKQGVVGSTPTISTNRIHLDFLGGFFCIPAHFPLLARKIGLFLAVVAFPFTWNPRFYCFCYSEQRFFSSNYISLSTTVYPSERDKVTRITNLQPIEK